MNYKQKQKIEIGINTIFLLIINFMVLLTVPFFHGYTTRLVMVIVAFAMGMINVLRPQIHSKLLHLDYLKRLANAMVLLYGFLWSTVISVVLYIFAIISKQFSVKELIFTAFWIIIVETCSFWCGMLILFFTSEQLRVEYRVVSVLVGLIPIAHLIMLFKMLHIAEKEIQVEESKFLLNKERHDQQVCKTKYPIFMVHGIFFRDFKYFNYWGRIPAELEKNGASIYYGNHESAASVARCGEELAYKILQLVKDTGCEKVNIIAHSKGGLDSRYAITLPGVAEHVASLTTINTPHRGCEFVDYLLDKMPPAFVEKVAYSYNKALKKLGDQNPSFFDGVNDLRASKCAEFNEQIINDSRVIYQSVGSVLNKATNGHFPLNVSYHICKHFSSDSNIKNDGLVTDASFQWGQRYELLSISGDKGISHGDMIDLNRENLDGFDVREFYVSLVSKIKQMGL